MSDERDKRELVERIAVTRFSATNWRAETQTQSVGGLGGEWSKRREANGTSAGHALVLLHGQLLEAAQRKACGHERDAEVLRKAIEAAQ